MSSHTHTHTYTHIIFLVERKRIWSHTYTPLDQNGDAVNSKKKGKPENIRENKTR